MARNEGYIVEFVSLGQSLKVTAVDPDTGTEVSMVASPRASQDELKRLATRKLEYVLDKQKRSRQPAKRRGLVV